MSDTLIGTVLVALIGVVGIIYGAWVKKRGDDASHAAALIDDYRVEIDALKQDVRDLKAAMLTMAADHKADEVEWRRTVRNLVGYADQLRLYINAGSPPPPPDPPEELDLAYPWLYRYHPVTESTQ